MWLNHRTMNMIHFLTQANYFYRKKDSDHLKVNHCSKETSRRNPGRLKTKRITNS